MLNEQLQKHIEQEAKAEAKKLTGRVPIFRMGYEVGYYDGGEKYVEKWQEVQQLVDRYEKALNEIQDIHKKYHDLNGDNPAANHLLNIAREALTPKTGIDE